MSFLLHSTVTARRVAGLTLVACAVLVASRLVDASVAAAGSKLVASCLFLAVAVISGARKSRYGRIILVGLACSWFGDMFLLVERPGFFQAGLVSFLIAHVAYIPAFSTYGQNDRWMLAALLPVAAVSLAVTIWLGDYLPDDMVVPVRVYTFVISLMVIVAFGARGAGGPMLIPIGATLFYLSDLSVASLQFTDPAFPHYVWGLPFYYTGQLALALSVAWVGKKGTTAND
jgi:uncharacterized membrane protein YhhN